MAKSRKEIDRGMPVIRLTSPAKELLKKVKNDRQMKGSYSDVICFLSKFWHEHKELDEIPKTKEKSYTQLFKDAGL